MEGNFFSNGSSSIVVNFWIKKRITAHTAKRLQGWGTILLNYNYEMEFLSSKKLGHADGLSRLIPKVLVPLDGTVIAALEAEKEVKDMLCNTVKKLQVTLDEIRGKAENDAFIKKMKRQVRLKVRNKNTRSISSFSICKNVLLYADWVVMPLVLQKKILKEFHLEHTEILQIYLLAWNGWRYWKGSENL